MLRRSLAVVALTALSTFGGTARLRADEPTPYIGEPPYRLTTKVVVPTDPLNPQPKKRFGCWATHFGDGCGSFRSDMVFIFGSCRSFYGEGCRKDPPSIYQPGYGPAGYVPGGAAGVGGGGCNCP
jgi:hypothetical protein